MARHWNTPAAEASVGMFQDLYKTLTIARRGLAIFQHHDGMSGTSKSYVMEDYHKK